MIYDIILNGIPLQDGLNHFWTELHVIPPLSCVPLLMSLAMRPWSTTIAIRAELMSEDSIGIFSSAGIRFPNVKGSVTM